MTVQQKEEFDGNYLSASIKHLAKLAERQKQASFEKKAELEKLVLDQLELVRDLLTQAENLDKCDALVVAAKYSAYEEISKPVQGKASVFERCLEKTENSGHIRRALPLLAVNDASDENIENLLRKAAGLKTPININQKVKGESLVAHTIYRFKKSSTINLINVGAIPDRINFERLMQEGGQLEIAPQEIETFKKNIMLARLVYLTRQALDRYNNKNPTPANTERTRIVNMLTDKTFSISHSTYGSVEAYQHAIGDLIATLETAVKETRENHKAEGKMASKYPMWAQKAPMPKSRLAESLQKILDHRFVALHRNHGIEEAPQSNSILSRFGFGKSIG